MTAPAFPDGKIETQRNTLICVRSWLSVQGQKSQSFMPLLFLDDKWGRLVAGSALTACPQCMVTDNSTGNFSGATSVKTKQ